MAYYAVVPKSTLSTLENCRIEKASNARAAVVAAFGRALNPKYEVGRWMAKDMGTRVAAIQSHSKRAAMLRDPAGWFDPYA